jgi:hypothetical protein
MLASYPQRPSLPYGVWLHHRFVREYASSFHRLQSEAQSPNALIAAYAVLCMAANPNLIPHDVFGRHDEVTLRDWTADHTISLGDFARMIDDLRNDLS